MNTLGPCILDILLILSVILDSYGLNPPKCHPDKLNWKEADDPAVCTDDNQPTEEPIIRRNGVQVSGQSIIYSGKYQVSYQPSRADDGQVLVCSVSEHKNCTFGPLNIVYKPKVMLTWISGNELLCTVDANPLSPTPIEWTTYPSYMIHYTDKGIKIGSASSMLNISQPTMILNDTTFTCSSRNDIGSDNVTTSYMERHVFRTETVTTSKLLSSSELQTENHGHTTRPTLWKVGKTGNVPQKSIPLFMILGIAGSIICLLILMLLGLYIYKRPYSVDDTDTKNNDNTDPIYVELNMISGQRSNTSDIYNSEIVPVLPPSSNPNNHYEHLPDVVSNKMEIPHNTDSLKHSSLVDSKCQNHVESSVLDNLPEKCLEELPAYFVLEKDDEATCTIYEDINDKYQQHQNPSEPAELGGQEQSISSVTPDENNIYAEIGTGNMGKDFQNYENEIYESIDNNKFQTRPLPELSRSILPSNGSDSKTCKIAALLGQQSAYTDECSIEFLLQ